MALCAGLQNSHALLSNFVSLPIEFSWINSMTYSAQLSGLQPGKYYIGAGRPRGNCDLKIDGKNIDSTKGGLKGVRGSLLLGNSFEVTESFRPEAATIQCDQEAGFVTGFTHVPIVSSFIVGVFIQLWRAGTEIFMGPFFSMILLLSLLTSKNKKTEFDRKNLGPHFLFGLCALLYSLSLAHYPRLFLAGLPASVLHGVLRCMFGLAFYFLCAHYSRLRKSLVFCYLFAACAIYVTSVFSPEHFDKYYDFIYAILPALTLVAVCDLFYKGLKSRSGYYILLLAISWFCAQIMDASVIAANIGVYTAPSLVALLTSMVALLKRNEDRLSEAAVIANTEVLRIVESSATIEEKLNSIGAVLFQNTSYRRFTVYADAYVLGLHDSPQQRLIRLTDTGYRKDISGYRTIDFSDGHGQSMKKALISGEATLSEGAKDHALYSIVPIGQYAVFNISNDSESPPFLAVEGHDLVQRLLPAIRVLSDRLVEYGARMAFAIESLRMLRGDGQWQMDIGCIFIDINDFSDSVEKYGESYAHFVSRVYLPALCQRVRKWAVREGSSGGDSVYLVCIEDLMLEKCSASEAVYRSLHEVMRFSDIEAAEMCRLQGFAPIRLQIGANAGTGTVICDAFQVRTSGALVNEASRLQKASTPGWTFVNADLAESWPSEGPLLIERAEHDLKKTMMLRGCKVMRQKLVRNVA